MAEQQVILKHIREAVGQIPLHELEIEVGFNRALNKEQFERVEEQVANGKWDSVSESISTDYFYDSLRVTTHENCHKSSAIHKLRKQTTDLGAIRIKTSHERPAVVPQDLPKPSMIRRKHRRERGFWGWKLCTTVVNPDHPNPTYEIEAELDWRFLVRRPYDLLALVGGNMIMDIAGMMNL